MTPEQVRELHRLQAEAKTSIDKIVETVKTIHEDSSKQMADFLNMLQEAIDELKKRRP